jgi:hypothetical protein
MALRTFEHFPENAKCPLCGKGTDSECFLASIDGTQDGHISQAIPIHTECLYLSWNRDFRLVYQRGV